MTQQLVITTPANTQTGDSPKSAFDKINANFTEVYGNIPVLSGNYFFGVDSGAVNAYVVTLASLLPAPSITSPPSLAAGLSVRFTPTHTDTGPSTLNFAGLGAVPIVNAAGVALSGGELASTGPVSLMYNGTSWQLFETGLNQLSLGAIFYPQTAAELTAGVTPTNFAINSDWLDPRRYGAVGDGVTDDTAAINKWIAVWNASINPASSWPTGLIFLVGPLNNMTASNGTWQCFSTLRSKPNSITGTASWLTISGANIRIFDLVMDGNQANYSSQVGNASVYLNAVTDFLLDGCSFINGVTKGVLFYQVNGARISNCHFDNNANLGIETNAASYVKFVNCTLNYNGYGFQKTLATNTFAAFGLALRFRTHHFTFTNCEAKQNGRDGLCTNQGSYAIKYIGCLAWMNGDGGFTLAADQQSTGLLGDGESCYDIEYTDCESYNNWSSGLSAYAPAYNVTIDGGRYYNNNREAGQLTLASSYISGIYFASGSLGIRVRAKAYDDRQLCAISSWANPTGNCTGWVAGTIGNYPRVAFYNASIVFQGYATIANEAGAPNVSFVTTPNNGVNLAAVAAGWFVSQRVQHNGCFFDNNCGGTVDIDGFGFLPGPVAYAGYKSVSGNLANGQNVQLPAVPLDYTELLANPTWDAAVTNWTFSTPGGGSANLYTTAGILLRSPGALQLVAAGGNTATGDSTLIAGALNYVQGAYVEGSCWVYAVNAGDANLFLYWTNGSQFFSSIAHPGGGWKQLKIGAFMGNGTTGLMLRVYCTTNKTNYFDNASLRVKTDPTDSRDTSYPSRNLPV